MRLFFFFFFFSLLLTSGQSYKILVYNSRFQHSHSTFLGMIADTLAEAGHNVTSLIPILDKTKSDGTEKSHKIHVQPHPGVERIFDQMANNGVDYLKINGFDPLAPIKTGPGQGLIYSLNCQKVLEEPGLIERLRAEQYDVYISENFDVCGMGLAHSIAPRAVIGSSATVLFGLQYDEFGVPETLSYRPAPAMTSLNVHSLADRLLNLYASFLTRWRFSYTRSAVNRVLRQHFGEEYPSIEEQSSNVAYVLTNSEPLLDYAAPTMTRVVEIPGIGAKQPKSLDKYWSSLLALRERSVLISLGSVISSARLPLQMRRAILEAISAFPSVTFIWKYEQPEDEFSMDEAAEVENLVLSKWLPQNDLLNHPNLSLFITHGGMASSQETAMRGVPGIFIPIFGDQPRNAGMMEYNRFGKVFNKQDLGDAEKLIATIREVLENEKYRLNARRISAMLARKPFSSREKLIKTVEYAAEFGPSTALRPQSLDMTFIEHNNLDVLTVFLLLLIVCVYSLLKCFVFVARMLERKRKID